MTSGISSASPSELKFEIGHVLFIDIVGYSQLLINKQSEQLDILRKIVRGTDDDARPRTDNPTRLLFRPLEPFLIESNVVSRPGQTF